MSSLTPLGAPAAPAPFGDTVLEETVILDCSTFTALGEQFEREAEARDALHARARKLDQRTSALLFRMHNEGATEASTLEIADIERELREAQAARRASSLRYHGGLSGATERALTLRMFHHFLREGSVLRYAATAAATDETVPSPDEEGAAERQLLASRDEYLGAAMACVGVRVTKPSSRGEGRNGIRIGVLAPGVTVAAPATR